MRLRISSKRYHKLLRDKLSALSGVRQEKQRQDQMGRIIVKFILLLKICFKDKSLAVSLYLN